MKRLILVAFMIAFAAIGCAPTGANPFIPPTGGGPSISAPSGAAQSTTQAPAGVQPAGQVAAPSGVQSAGSGAASNVVEPGPGFRTPYTVPSGQPDAIAAQRNHVGQNIWQGVQLNLNSLPDLGPNEIYLAHGDVQGNGKCAVKVWRSSHPKPGELSAATWQLYRIRAASPQALEDAIAVEQQIAERGTSPCPLLK